MPNKTSDAQIAATRRWEERNKKKTTIDTYKRKGRTFIRHHATEEDIHEFRALLDEREKTLKTL